MNATAGQRPVTATLSSISHWIDGKPVAGGGRVAPVYNPSLGRVVREVSLATSAEVERAVASAARAFPDWSRHSALRRARVLFRFKELLDRDAKRIARAISEEHGKTLDDALGEVTRGIEVVEFACGAPHLLKGEFSDSVGRGVDSYSLHQPLGVVAGVTPFNFPAMVPMWMFPIALVCGNSFVLKPSERDPSASLLLAELLTEAGLPDGVLNVVTGFGHEAGKALALHPDVNCLAFTGSTRTGRSLMEYSGQSNLKQVWLELGGKSPNLIFADTKDLAAAAEMAAFGIFFNAGQVCSANARLLVERRIQAEIVERLAAIAAAMQPGDPLDPATRMGALVDHAHLDHVMRFVEAAPASARLVTGGSRVPLHPRGAFMQPTIFDNVDPGCSLARDEIFGPVLSVIPFDTEEEAIRLANDSVYGLAASVWTADLDRSLRVSDRLNAGTVSVNTVDALSPQTPFGGMGQSGFGRDLSLHALDKFTALKTVWIKYTA